jgi:hypothetical protein
MIQAIGMDRFEGNPAAEFEILRGVDFAHAAAAMTFRAIDAAMFDCEPKVIAGAQL